MTRTVGWLLGPGVLALVDATGRPLGEQAAPNYRGGDEARVLRFGDGRDASGRPANVGALRQVRRTWSATLVALRGLFVDEAPTLARVYRRVTAALRWAPAVHLRSRRPPTSAEAALWKTVLGFHDVIATELLGAHWDADAAPPDAATLLARLDAEDWLIGTTQVCAGSRRAIAEAWDALGTTGPPPTGTPLERPWFREAFEASFALEALMAVAAGAARRASSLPGRGTYARALLTAVEVPRMVEVLRRQDDVGPLVPSLLFASTAVPPSRRRLVAALPADPSPHHLRDIDHALWVEAKPLVRTIERALELQPATTVEEALRAAVDPSQTPVRLA
ncbi:MAG: hypothetical protein AAGN82_22060 [Myxococcota bacterium]